MNKGKRIDLMRTLLMQAGARGMTRIELLQRMADREAQIDDRTFYRYIQELSADDLVHIDDDPGVDASAAGARRVYFSDRTGMSTMQAIRLGRSIEAFENSSGRLFGPTLDDGTVSLHHLAHAKLSDVHQHLRNQSRTSRSFYIGSLWHVHYWLEVPDLLGHDLEVRVGRLESAKQRPANPLTKEQLWVGLPGPDLLSRLLGPKQGHLHLTFPQGVRTVTVEDRTAGSSGPMTTHALSDGRLTPIVPTGEAARRLSVTAPTELLFAGLRGLIWV